MVDEMLSGLQKTEANIANAETYLQKINGLNLGVYSIIDGMRFPERIEFGKDGVIEGKTYEFDPPLQIPTDREFHDVTDKMLEQIKPFLEKGEYEIYIQHVKRI